jgi:hypothetical protein
MISIARHVVFFVPVGDESDGDNVYESDGDDARVDGDDARVDGDDIKDDTRDDT